jgi:hypothetical protein
MNPAVRDSLLWGVVGGLVFLVLLQGYHLAGGEFVSPGVIVGVAALVVAVTAVAAHTIRPWVRRHSRNESG